MHINFLGSPNLMDFAAFSSAIGNWWGNSSCIPHKCIPQNLIEKNTHTMGKV